MKQRVESPPVLECVAGREMTALYRNHLGSEVLGLHVHPLRWAGPCSPRSTRKRRSPLVETLKDRIIAFSIVIALLAFFLAYLLVKESQRSPGGEVPARCAHPGHERGRRLRRCAGQRGALLNPAVE